MIQAGYFRYPTINGNKIVFVCEDDLWSVPAEGGVAIRITSNLGEITRPFLSPDGKKIAFIGREEGHPEVYVMPAEGGQEERLTFLGTNSHVVGWTPDGQHILFTSNYGQPFSRIFHAYKMKTDGVSPEPLNLGPVDNISYGPKKGVVIGRNTTDPARWKRYRGGTAGVLWIDPDGKGAFRKLLDLHTNFAAPMWVGNRIYFISDHEGIGNIYSCTPAGTDLRRHTEHNEYYVRNASTDGKRIVYHAGGELFVLDPAKSRSSNIEVQFNSPRVQRHRKFVSASQYLEDYNIHPEGHSVIINARGKAFVSPNWEGAAMQFGQADGVRYRLTQWLNEKNKFVTISDEGGDEALEIHSTDFNVPHVRLNGLDLGRAIEMKVSPTEEKVVLSNHRFELILVDLEKKKAKLLDSSKYAGIEGFSWSPDGKWVTYSCGDTLNTISIKICNVKDYKVYRLTETRFRDVSPSFDPEGRFIYFLSYRDFNPVYDNMYFDLNFPRGMRPYLISLKTDTVSPFAPIPKFLKEAEKEEKEKEKTAKKVEKKASSKEKEKDKKPPEVVIDFEGIEKRVVAFPVHEGLYHKVWGVKGKVLFSSAPVRGALDQKWYDSDNKPTAILEYYDFEQQKTELVAHHISSFKVSAKTESLIYRSGGKLRVTTIAPMDKNKPAEEAPGKRSGWLDLNRFKVSINPPSEWKQMYREIWRLQQQHFWTDDMGGIDWPGIYKRYLPLLDKISTRSEFSDLIWELQGELGTSHAYELGGDYRRGPNYKQGFLGADFEYDSKSDGYRVTHVVNGDSWHEREDSSFHRIGVNVKEGDILLAVAGQKVSKDIHPQELLVNQANHEIILTLAGKKKNQTRNVLVKVLPDEFPARYREWVENNRRKVHEASKGKVGYVHIPNMGPEGYAEFHRYYMSEIEKDSLVVDVRYNGGGHVSQLILEKLLRKRIGYDVKRWGVPEPYPSYALLGPIVALTNEYAGSDGDIFSHCFKLFKLGKLVGKRTWGGVIGIWPRHKLVDGSITTQPEFSFWFEDVGWKVENYGTEPDIEVEITPQDWKRGFDPQLDKSVEIVLKELKKNPPKMPDFSKRPRLTIPEKLGNDF